MLDSETRRRIDSARDILVGKVPDPKSQVEQITIALVYKFMDDMDRQSIEMGGRASFFRGRYEKYSWSNIFNPRLGGIEMLALYGEAITCMSQNENLPQLFRDIFKNAFLPYRDPETLKLFLKTINEFTYDHSEKLGDAFEYLLSVLGSQGDAGQFRTPRHIIDFMVKVVDPKKNETVLDPACGTAGFLISAYKHIVADTPTQPSPQRGEGKGGGLTAQEKQRLYENFTGYDISPDMVRLSLVNLYLHGFVKPKVHEYDTLTSEERWNEYADVILANPPFMSPKGGIQPHKRFSVQSNRSEVLFVDYMAEHLTPNGRAAIIVPEGIIFQSAGAYKQLRKYLIEHNYLWAVVSLPAGVFNPYAGVKTSILFLDKPLARKTDQILFVKVEADGFDLGAQRRPIDRNGLPDALNILNAWKHAVASGEANNMSPLAPPARAGVRAQVAISPPLIGAGEQSPVSEEIASSGRAPSSQRHAGSEGVALSLTNAPRKDMYLLVPTSRLAMNGEYNLSADRYRDVTRVGKQTYPMVALGEIATFYNGRAYKQEELLEDESKTLVLRVGNLFTNNSWYYSDLELEENKYCLTGDLLYAWSASFGPFIWDGPRAIYHYHIWKIEHSDHVEKMFLYHMLQKVTETIRDETHGIAMLHMTKANMEKVQIPLPPLEIQRQIVDEIAGHQRIIDGARQVVEGWKPNLDLPKGLPTVLLGDVCEVKTGKLNANAATESGKYPFFTCSKEVFRIDTYAFDCEAILLSGNNASGDFDVKRYKGQFNAYQRTYVITIKSNYADKLDYQVLQTTLENNLASLKYQAIGGLTKYLKLGMITSIEIPLLSLDIQHEIVARIEKERAIVEGNRVLIRIYEEKIKKVIERVWES